MLSTKEPFNSTSVINEKSIHWAKNSLFLKKNYVVPVNMYFSESTFLVFRMRCIPSIKTLYRCQRSHLLGSISPCKVAYSSRTSMKHIMVNSLSVEIKERLKFDQVKRKKYPSPMKTKFFAKKGFGLFFARTLVPQRLCQYGIHMKFVLSYMPLSEEDTF